MPEVQSYADTLGLRLLIPDVITFTMIKDLHGGGMKFAVSEVIRVMWMWVYALQEILG